MSNTVLRHRLLAGLIFVVLVGSALVSVVTDSLLPLILIAAPVAAVVLLVHPRWVVVLLVVVWAGPLDLRLLARSVGGLRVTAGLVLLALGLAWVVMSRLQGRGPRQAAQPAWFVLPLVLFGFALVLALVRAALAGDPLGSTVNTGLACVAGLSYFIARDAYARDPDALARDLVVTSGLCSFLVVLGVATGLDGLYGPEIGYVITGGNVSQTVRIDPPLLRLLSITLLMIGPGRVLARGRWSWLRWPLIVAMVLTEVLSLTRSTWLPLIIATILIPVMATRRSRWSLLARNVAVAVLILMLALSLALSGLAGEQGRLAAERLMSVADTEVVVDDSYQDRARENVQALARIREHPIAGIGLPRPYGAYVSMPDPIADSGQLYDQRRFIHQSYLGLWMWMGLPGVVALLVLLATIARTTAVVFSERTRARAAPVAALAGLFALAVSSTFQTNLIYPPAHLALGLGLAYVETWVFGARALHTHSDADQSQSAIELPVGTVRGSSHGSRGL
ncbi:O-antigen ligase family protein [Gephyromycinifex aptenodytis]|uniref:O-antigen ligase family protein n=1 Tax=Gephyromycinifex aptenodytis TaxID=2716227 RepID=UPI001446504E|nr:O-antigen ligase family protein [Gephyromycinifex aptenodytis]